jgi:hypothetical protein
VEAAHSKQKTTLKEKGLIDFWTDEDVAFDMRLEKWGTHIELIKDIGNRRRLFHAWYEEWEEELIHEKGPVAEARLYTKYEGMMWIDPDPEEKLFSWWWGLTPPLLPPPAVLAAAGLQPPLSPPPG